MSVQVPNSLLGPMWLSQGFYPKEREKERMKERMKARNFILPQYTSERDVCLSKETYKTDQSKARSASGTKVMIPNTDNPKKTSFYKTTPPKETNFYQKNPTKQTYNNQRVQLLGKTYWNLTQATQKRPHSTKSDLQKRPIFNKRDLRNKPISIDKFGFWGKRINS